MKITFLTITLIAAFYIISVQSERVYTRRHRKRVHVLDKVKSNVEEVHEVFRTALRPPSFSSSEVAIERFLKCDAMCYRRRQLRKQLHRTTVSPNISTSNTTQTPVITKSTTLRTTTPVITTTPRATLPTNPYANINPDYTHISEWNHGPSITATKYPADNSKNINIQILEVENVTNMPAIIIEEPKQLPTTPVPILTNVNTTPALFQTTASEEPRSSTTETPISTSTVAPISTTTVAPTTTTDVPIANELPTNINQTTTTSNLTLENTTSWYVEKKFIKLVPIAPVETDLESDVNISTDAVQEFDYDSSLTEESRITSSTVLPVEYAELSTVTAEDEDPENYDGQYEDQYDDYDSNTERNSETDN